MPNDAPGPTRPRSPGEPRSPGKPRRRNAQATRLAILEAAQKRLIEDGPEALRLQDIAADLGISHPAILHHFGRREGLLQALVSHALEGLQVDLLAALSHPEAEGASAEAILDRVSETLGERGHARLIAWLALGGRAQTEGDPPAMIRELSNRVHARRQERAQAEGLAAATREDTDFSVILAAVALLGDAVLGDGVRRSAGLDGDDATRRRFRAWLGRLLARHLSGPGEGTDQ